MKTVLESKNFKYSKIKIIDKRLNVGAKPPPNREPKASMPEGLPEDSMSRQAMNAWKLGNGSKLVFITVVINTPMLKPLKKIFVN